MLLDQVADHNPTEWSRRLPTQEMFVLRELLDADDFGVTYERLIERLWPDEDGGPLCASNIVCVVIWKIRRRLQPGWYIVCDYGLRYRLVYEPAELQLAA